jgi:acyl-CoA synthetase (NDP forming)
MSVAPLPNRSGDTCPNLDFLFEPRSVAIVGASEDAHRMGGGLVLRFLLKHGFQGKVYPVNPKYDQIAGLRCYPSLAAIPEPVDLAVITVPAAAVLGVLLATPVGQTRVALVLTSGFGELNEDGRRLERQLLDAARERGIALIGPNSVGLVNLHNGLVLSISQFFDQDTIRSGEIALVSQSGAFGTAILAQAEREGLRFGYFVSSGNESDLEFSDFGADLVGRSDVKIICGYVEGVRDGAKFIKFAKNAAHAGKPIVVLKVGSSEAGAEAARSHTGSLAGSDSVTQAVFDAYGILRATDGENLLDLLKVFTKTPPSCGRRIAILSHSGGAGVLAADAAEAMGAVVAPLPPDLRDTLAGMLPDFASIRNPLDMTGGASLQGKLMAGCLRAVLSHDGFDGAVLAVNLIWREGATLMAELADVAARVGKPFAVSWVAPLPETSKALLDAPFPVFGDPARAARVLVQRMLYDERRRTMVQGKSPQRPFVPMQQASLATVAGQGGLLHACGIRLPREVLAQSLKEAQEFRKTVGGPVAVKVASPEIAHRTEIGGVVIGIEDDDALEEAYDAVLAAARRSFPNARIDGVLVQEMVQGVETIVGVKRDPTFGPMVAVGPGGTLVDLLRRVELRPAPMSRDDAAAMLQRSPLNVLLNGYRGGPRLDSAALAETVERVSWLAVDRPEIAELDLNPVVVLPEGQGCVAVDYKITVTSSGGAA